jgi:hypothetical protein
MYSSADLNNPVIYMEDHSHVSQLAASATFPRERRTCKPI